MVLLETTELIPLFNGIIDFFTTISDFVFNNIGLFISLLVLFVVVKTLLSGFKNILSFIISVMVVLLILNFFWPDLTTSLVGPAAHEKLNVINAWIKDLISKVPVPIQ